MACKKLVSLPSSYLWERFSFWGKAEYAFKVRVLLSIECIGSTNFTWDYRESRHLVYRELHTYYRFLPWWSRNKNYCLCSSNGQRRFIEAHYFKSLEHYGMIRNKVCSREMYLRKLRFFWVLRLWYQRKFVFRWSAWQLDCNRCLVSAPKQLGLW